MSDGSLQEVVFTLGGKTYRIRPTFKVLARIETSINQSARTLGMKCFATGASAAERGGTPEISIVELAGIFAAMLADDKTAPNLEQIGDVLVDDGYLELLLPVGNFLTRAQKGNKLHEQEMLAKRKAEEEAAAAAGSDPPKDAGSQAG